MRKHSSSLWVRIGVPAALLALPLAASGAPPDYAARIERVLAATPLVDGHNDLAWEIRDRFKSNLDAVDLKSDTSRLPFPAGGAPLMTDIPRLRAGRVGGQFWSVWVPVDLKGYEAVQATLEQIDLVKRMCARYGDDFAMAYAAADVRRIHQGHRIACLIGIEGGHQINDSLAVLRQMYAAGARYMTLTHTSNTDWADSATDAPAHHGLTPFGEDVVREMNRLGMLVDLSHVSPETMKAALAVSAAPVMFSHSSARAVVDHPRNVPDDVLRGWRRTAAWSWRTSRPGTSPTNAGAGMPTTRRRRRDSTARPSSGFTSDNPRRPRRRSTPGRGCIRCLRRPSRRSPITSIIFAPSPASITWAWAPTSTASRMRRSASRA